MGLRALVAAGSIAVLASLNAASTAKPPSAAKPAWTAKPPWGAKPAWTAKPATYQRTPARVARGQYLVDGILQCFICHSDRDWTAPGAPPVRGLAGAGHVWTAEGKPWLVSPNLTPDRETGIGRW